MTKIDKWKPKDKKEVFYYIEYQDFYKLGIVKAAEKFIDKYYFNMLLFLGNCFRTKKEAQKALKKMERGKI